MRIAKILLLSSSTSISKVRLTDNDDECRVEMHTRHSERQDHRERDQNGHVDDSFKGYT